MFLGVVMRLQLDQQQWMFNYQTGYLLHPSIPTSSTSLCIADIGTGTGLWLAKLARELPPSTQLDGFDISAAQFPPMESLPSNITLQIQNALEPVAPSLVGKYDVVHVGIFCLNYGKSRSTALFMVLLSNLETIEPGGYLQWDELDIGNNKVVSSDPSMIDTFAGKLLGQLAAVTRKRNWDLSWIPRLNVLLAEHDLSSVNLYKYKLHNELVKPWTNNALMVLEEMSDNMMRLANTDEDREKALASREMLDKAYEESLRGVSINTEILVAMGQKPI
ncbi:hypothetical protein MMC14_002434 [Varicellaria rhodocarpa]|nr:hypothetical protein [Varicellaria rhodocarpa]